MNQTDIETSQQEGSHIAQKQAVIYCRVSSPRQVKQGQGLQAEDDIISIYVHGVQEFGVSRAESYHADLERVFGLIADTPYIARERLELIPPIRIHPFGSHIILYNVEDNGDVLILRVRHGREDWIDNPQA